MKTKLQQLGEHITNQLRPMIRINNFDAWQAGGTLMLLNGEDTGTGFLLAKWKYDAVIQIEHVPQKRFNAYTILALVAAWLVEHDAERSDFGLADPDLDIEEISSDNAQITIDLQLMDDIEIVEDDNGPVLFDGKRYRVDISPFYIAESFELQTTIASEVDA